MSVPIDDTRQSGRFPWLKAGATAAVYFVAGTALIALAGYDIYTDAFAQGDVLWTTLLENLVTLVLALSVIGAGAWITRRPDDVQVDALARWTLIVIAFVGVITGVVLGTQALQTHWKPWIIYGNFTAGILLAGFATGLYASWLQHKAFFDALTGLPNRDLVLQRMGETRRWLRGRDGRFAVLYIDLDNFKDVNEGFGTEAGDRLLRIVARRIVEQVGTGDTVARIGGDELVVLVSSVGTHEEAQARTETIKRAFQEQIYLDTGMVRIQASLGIALYPDDADEPVELLRCADAAARHAKRSGGDQWAFYKPELLQAAANRVAVGGRLRDAIDHGEIHVAYQPVVRLADEAVIGYEALARWYHPQEGWIPPDRFIPVAEQNGLIDELAQIIARSACAQIARTSTPDGASIFVSINVSPLQVSRPDFGADIRAMCDEAGIPPEKLVLEITEQAMLSLDTVVLRKLDEVRAAGMSIAIDDFGTGYASLSYIKHLPADRLKVDRKFITDIDHDRGNQAIAAATLTLAKAFGLEQTAEGVETRAEADKLRAMGYASAQGYFFGKPRVGDLDVV